MASDLRHLWANRRFRRLLLARVVSNLGNGMAPIALAFGVLSLRGANAGSLSLVTTSQMVPLVLFLLLGGVAADRFGRSQLVGATDMIGSIFAGLSGISFLFDFASVPLLCFNAFVFGVLNALWYPAFSGLMPEIVPKGDIQSANALVGIGSNLSYTAGAALAGVLVASAGPGWAILVDASSFFVAGVLVFGLRTPATKEANSGTEPSPRTSILTQLRQGWREFASRRWIVITVVGFSFYLMVWQGFVGVLAPVQAKERLGGARDMSLMMFGFGAGALLGTVLALRIRPRRPLRLVSAMMPLLGLWIFALAIPTNIWILFATAFLTGVEFDLFYALWLTSLQTNVPSEALSRVGSYDAFGSTVFAPIGVFLAGPLAHAIGTRTTLIGAGVIAVATSLAVFSSKSVRSLESEGPGASTHAETIG